MLEFKILSVNEIKDANRKAHGDIEILILPQPEDFEIAKAQRDQTLRDVVEWLEAHKVAWLEDGKGNVDWVTRVDFTQSEWAELKANLSKISNSST